MSSILKFCNKCNSLLNFIPVIPLKAVVQTPPIYSKNHQSDLLWKCTIPWVKKNIIEKLHIEKTSGSGRRKGEKYIICDRVMKSLNEYGLPMYPKYEPKEIEILIPKSLQ